MQKKKANDMNNMEIKQGDKVSVSKDAPKMHVRAWAENRYCKVAEVEDDNAIITDGSNILAIPTKYLVKVDAEAKFKVGDRVRVKGCGYEPNLHKGDIGEILDTNDKEQCFVLFKKSQAWIYVDCLEPYTEPTEQTEAEKPNHTITIPVEVDLADSYWDAYAADLAREITVKSMEKSYGCDPEQGARGVQKGV